MDRRNKARVLELLEELSLSCAILRNEGKVGVDTRGADAKLRDINRKIREILGK